jgi:hypothetical protein
MWGKRSRRAIVAVLIGSLLAVAGVVMTAHASTPVELPKQCEIFVDGEGIGLLSQTFVLGADAPAQANPGDTFTITIPAQTWTIQPNVAVSNYTVINVQYLLSSGTAVAGSAHVTAPGTINGFPLTSSADASNDMVGVEVSSSGFGPGTLVTPAVTFDVVAGTDDVQFGAYQAFLGFSVGGATNGGFASCDLLTLLSTTTISGSGGSSSTTTTTTVGGPTLPSLSVSDVSVTEPLRGSVRVRFTVTLSAPSSNRVSADFTTMDGTAIAPGDYRARHGRVRFGRGKVVKQVSVRVRSDLVSDPNEAFSLVLSNPVNATIADGTGIATVLDG